MHVAVTGASGMLGRYAVAELLQAGHQVRAIDRVLPRERTAPFHHAEIRDLGQVCGALRGCDAVLHLAAIPHPIGNPQEEVFAINVMGTFNVLEACDLLGIRRVVAISSMSATGHPYRTHPVPLRYFPLDQVHPLLPQDAYGLSKQVGEDICRTFHRRTGGVAISMRFPLIWDRAARPDALSQMAEQTGLDTLWCYIDARDAARACRLALEVEGLTDEAFYVMAPETFSPRPSAELVRQYFPDAEIRGDTTGRWALCDWSPAKEMLGFHADHVWIPGAGNPI